MSIRAVLRGADEHFDDVVMQAVIELPLESPLELRMIEVAGMKFEVVGVHWNRRVPELDDDFDRLALGASREIKQGVLVEFQLSQNTFKPRVGIGHPMILTGVVVCVGRAPSPAAWTTS